MTPEPTYDLIVRNGWIVTMDPDGNRYQSADIAVSKGVIAAIGTALPGEGAREIDAKGNVVLPGLVDAHMHTTLLRGVGDDLPLMRWLYEVMFPKDAQIQPQHIHAAALMNQNELIRGGVTTFLDIFRFPAEAAAVAEQSGLRGVFCPQMIDEPAGSGETLESNLAFIETWHDRVPERIYTWFGPHAPYSNFPETYGKIAEYAEQYDIGYHTHICETVDEVNQIKEKYGKSSVQLLADVGALGPRLSVAHGIYLAPEDIALLAERGVGVVHNPSSNMKLASGVAPVPALMEAGVTVGLGTDSNLSNNNLDMFEEMRLAAFLHKLTQGDPSVLPCETMLRMATMGSAACLGMDDIIGSLEVGKRADIIIVDVHQPHLNPILPEPHTNVIEQIVYSASAADVMTTIVEGQILMHERQVLTLDWHEAEPLVREMALDLLARADTWRRLGKEE
ncbi:amidohydrolase [bacterium]|nr:amidohydrolase [bacterium]